MLKNVLNFWFDELQPQQWWVKDSQVDAQITQHFSDLHTAAQRGELFHWRTTAEGRLAEVIVLDQFSRNLFRDSAAAFACDGQALCLAQEAISSQADQQLNAIQRSFLYMPFMHSESLIIHAQAEELFRTNGLQANIDAEIKHKNIIEKFGRYPHRNALLSRVSSPEERAFLQQPDSIF
ncbi:MAG: DUF924 domain-containing protein [Pseudomonadales bacterium]|nr:DUF924 domain-containing protein [Pseudomonadales bacterium]